MSIPWTTVDQPDAGPKAVVLVTWFELASRLRVPSFMRYGPPLWWQARHSPGLLGVAFRSEPFKGTFWTLSAWTDRKSLASYTRTDPHGAAMEKIRPWMQDFVRSSWEVPVADLPARLRDVRPLWAEAERRVADELVLHRAERSIRGRTPC
ncbi:hypothetical protein J4573_17545 [Actinomadura barringtoniae]|uniref:DUF3291 domain-containing protein n=1 Tax=Actinomadura barringtoniae TaxID=1427535 RepID=A0A939T242_9ACTN|nr:hypothetical protein [Actinomadura barringtoniae]MBO2448911.1 hypothetical protein [Actinomadura barringtoniae]